MVAVVRDIRILTGNCKSDANLRLHDDETSKMSIRRLTTFDEFDDFNQRNISLQRVMYSL